MSIFTRDTIYLSADKQSYFKYDAGAGTVVMVVEGTQVISATSTGLDLDVAFDTASDFTPETDAAVTPLDLGSSALMWAEAYIQAIDAGRSGLAGSVDIFPSTALKGKLALTAADSAGDTTTTIVNASQSGARTYTIPDAGASASFAMTEGAQTLNGVLSLQAATDGLVAGAGQSGTEVELGSTAGTALNYRFRGSHSTGDMRGMYLRLDFDTANGSGEALRAFTEIENVSVAAGGTINGAHITLNQDGASGSIQGAGHAVRATLEYGTGTTPGGTVDGIGVDLAAASGVTFGSVNIAGIRFTTSDTGKWPVAFAFDSVVGSGNAIEAATSAMGTANTAWALHIQVDGADGYIPVFDNKTWS